MQTPDPSRRFVSVSPIKSWRVDIPAWSHAKLMLRPFARRSRLNKHARIAELWQIAAPKQEQLFFGGCLLVFWLISAASFSGYVILTFFILVALARLAKNMCLALAEKMPRRSRYRHHLVTWVSVAFFAFLTARGCYLAAVIVDTEFRSNPFGIYAARK